MMLTCSDLGTIRRQLCAALAVVTTTTDLDKGDLVVALQDAQGALLAMLERRGLTAYTTRDLAGEPWRKTQRQGTGTARVVGITRG